ncbi:UDP-N-acetylmuramate dehydrogenase [Campylobacter fetus]|uniref:UDP-N-acetylenolpyruvoylglucosamine reductase n=1 Tax=Campylobacter fetus subsp. testudinum TaxID=1507806 RepID=A0AAX0H9S4_CAMFE|nr:UDP-N-acetylmuramate dehydrogenase [Campylobacter fetus]AGZ81103.1 UDP-N-acetylenolpyruvoylglucosamine reductase [Campylobacter fetus subsp. testudinum 03-427]AJB44859.1 UDP-N-acetylenolpyruvoylglucosamine reductase [Campylobacter fetus subsp. testudinum]ALV64197.1 UDP-N-acetylenolpyruvoylglucosamine reductase [Campylobacter fetus subsp. testudinum Sp3]AVK80481.1 UDP-N-acetylmuramate dehydrogenase [Campylobacter fetus subsp. testudinum]EAI4321504.1 UDP-N-acetylmuramate dehydrogenase [Campyl
MKIDFSKLSSVKIGGIFDVEVIDEIRDFDGVLIGGANNILISPNPPKMGILSSKFDYIKFENGILKVGAKTKTSTLFKFVQEHRLGGFEFIKKIPGTMGGLITMNAGLKEYEISQNLKNVTTNFGQILKNDCDFSYRHSSIKGVIYEASFEIVREFSDELSSFLNAKRTNQPKGASFGSCFTNPEGKYAGALLEAARLKGFRIGGCGFSEIHANFLINYGGGSFEDALSLINLAKKRVLDEFGIELKSEVVIL